MFVDELEGNLFKEAEWVLQSLILLLYGLTPSPQEIWNENSELLKAIGFVPYVPKGKHHLFLWAIALRGIYEPYWHILSIKHPWSSEALLDVLEVGNKKLKAP